MKKKNLEYVFKMIIKTSLIALPLFGIAFSCFAPQREQTIVGVNYMYNTNVISSVDDIKVNNIYAVDIDIIKEDTEAAYNFASMFYYNFYDDYGNILNFSLISSYDVSTTLFIDANDSSFYNSNYGMGSLFLYDGLDSFLSVVISTDTDTQQLFDNNLLSICPNEYIPINDVSTNIIKPTMETQMIEFANNFLDIPINHWYRNLVNAMGLSLPTNLMLVVFIYPLYVLWVEVFDLVLHCFLILPKLGHKLLGESD